MTVCQVLLMKDDTACCWGGDGRSCGGVLVGFYTYGRCSGRHASCGRPAARIPDAECCFPLVVQNPRADLQLEEEPLRPDPQLLMLSQSAVKRSALSSRLPAGSAPFLNEKGLQGTPLSFQRAG